MTGDEALTKLLVQLGSCAQAFRMAPDTPQETLDRMDELEVHLPGLTLGQVRAAYVALHVRLLGYRPTW